MKENIKEPLMRSNLTEELPQANEDSKVSPEADAMLSKSGVLPPTSPI